MRKAIITLLALATNSLSCSSFSEKEDPAPFNGKNLDGWSYYLVEPAVQLEDVWSVQDGILVCKGEPLGYLYTKKEFTTNFKLVVEWRWAPSTEPGNSGVLLRINGEPRGIPRSQEAQLASGSAGDLYGFHGMKLDGDPARRRTGKNDLVGELVGFGHIQPAEKAAGEWNLYEITAEEDRLTVFVNGEKVNEAWDCELVQGPIGLQSEGGEIHFRRVELTPLGD